MSALTLDERLTIIGLVLAGIAAVAGLFAATYAIRADLAARAGAREERRRWLRDIQPRPVVQIQSPEQTPPPNNAALQISNNGGAVVRGFIAVRIGSGYYGTPVSIAAHSVPLLWSDVPKIADAPVGSGRQVLLAVAQDADGNWWDCQNETMIPDFTGDGAALTALVNDRILETTAALVEGAQKA